MTEPKIYTGQQVQMHFLPIDLERDGDDRKDMRIYKVLDGDIKGTYVIVLWDDKEPVAGKRYINRDGLPRDHSGDSIQSETTPGAVT